ncbi:hypothetical protein Tco_0953057 [Tanacetum coccineum]|uniref:Uncharacterized protein n=1 Tax=Tanacetum coccineum TaxID=301880 RepID=A0ABQ5E134_9ASTR
MPTSGNDFDQGVMPLWQHVSFPLVLSLEGGSTWWNSHVMRRELFCGVLGYISGESDRLKLRRRITSHRSWKIGSIKPKTMQEAVELATELMDKNQFCSTRCMWEVRDNVNYENNQRANGSGREPTLLRVWKLRTLQEGFALSSRAEHKSNHGNQVSNDRALTKCSKDRRVYSEDKPKFMSFGLTNAPAVFMDLLNRVTVIDSKGYSMWIRQDLIPVRLASPSRQRRFVYLLGLAGVLIEDSSEGFSKHHPTNIPSAPRSKGRLDRFAYKLELPEELSGFKYISLYNLKKCHADEPLAIPLDGLHFDDKLLFVRNREIHRTP